MTINYSNEQEKEMIFNSLINDLCVNTKDQSIYKEMFKVLAKIATNVAIGENKDIDLHVFVGSAAPVSLAKARNYADKTLNDGLRFIIDAVEERDHFKLFELCAYFGNIFK